MLDNTIKFSLFFIFHIIILILFNSDSCYAAGDDNRNSEELQSLFQIGVIRDLNSPFGSMTELCMDMAISDFYSAHPNYKTRLQLYKKDAKTVFDVNFAVLELLKHGVLGILAPQGSIEETFLAAVGEKVRIPIISFTLRSTALDHADNRYFVRTTLDDVVQAKALAALCQRFQWPEVVILYEDIESSNQFVSRVNKELQDLDIQLTYITAIPSSASNSYVLKELKKLTTKETRVFLVHMNPLLGHRLFALASTAGMMSEGYAWIITDNLSIFLNSSDSTTSDSMDGVVGIRPYVFALKKLERFKKKWERNIVSRKTTTRIMELNVYGLWAYDTITALATALENIGPLNSSLIYTNTTPNGTYNTGLRITSFGPRLLSELSGTKFRGLSGDFELVDGKLKPSTYEIFNVVGTGERRVGFWTPDKGIIKELGTSGEPTHSNSTKELKNIIWPGDSLIQPNGRAAIIPNGKLRVGIPWKPGFKEFVNTVIDPTTKHVHATGFSIDIFFAARKALPFPVNYEFICYNDSRNSNWSYDNMLRKIPEEYDMVVADTTIWAPRSSYVDFSLPYSESGVVLIVKNRKPLDMWIFTKPLRWDLWLAIIVACILMTIVLYILERRAINTGEEAITPHIERPGMVFWSPIAILAFQERNMVANNWSVFVLVCWLFMAFILMQSFTASLSAILTVDQINFAFSEDYKVGYHKGSFMKDFLTNQLNIKESMLKSCLSLEEYHNDMSLGSKKGGIDAIFDEIPYMKLFLKRYGSKYKMVGPTYRTDGLGFAFPIGSPLVAYFSRAILNVTQGPEMNYLEEKNFGPGYSSQDPLSSTISQGTSSLTLREFGGLFILVGSFTLFALFCSETSIGRKFTDVTGHFIQNRFRSKTPQVHSVEGTSIEGDKTTHDGVNGNCEFIQNNSNSPRLGQDRDAQHVREPSQQDEEEENIDETSLNNEANVVQNVGVGIENHGGYTPSTQLNQVST